MIHTKSKPGPPRTSCLTCRKRRKKCDLTRPACERCLKRGLQCLWYSHSELHDGTQEDPNLPAAPQLQPVLTAVPALVPSLEPMHLSVVNSQSGNSLNSLTLESCQYRDIDCASYDHIPSALGSAPFYSAFMPTTCAQDNRAAMLSLDDYNCAQPQHWIQLTTSYNGQARRPMNATELPCAVSSTRRSENYLSIIIQALCTSIPPSVDTTRITREEHFSQIIHEYHLHRAKHWFMLPPPYIRNALLQGPKTMIWAMYLGAKLFQALSENAHRTMIPTCIGWIDKLDQKFDKFRNKSSLDDATDWLLTELELAFLKFTAIGCSSGYSVLQKALPVFLFVIAANPDLHTEHRGGNLVISFPITFGAPFFSLKWFIMYDTITSLLLGILPLVEYGYDGECDPASHGLEWLHGIPVVLAETISQVNSWRAGSRVAPLDDWRNLERRVLAWQPQLAVEEAEGLGANITARLAIQEGWRHVALIYIYMGMCGVSSHDTRVQASIKQLLQLGEAIDNLPIGVHVFIHCVVAGLGARYEKHRSIIHKRILSFRGTRVWLFHGAEFGRILEHLWYGAGAGGAPVTWDDYVRSRCAVVPI